MQRLARFWPNFQEYNQRLQSNAAASTEPRRETIIMRTCPKCKDSTISLFALAIGRRPRCKTCGSVVGPHWIFAGVFGCFLAVFMGFLGIYLMVNIDRILAMLSLAASVLIVCTMAARVAPLEIKEKWWAA